MSDLPMAPAGEHGAISWVDLSTPDIAAADRFYGELLGWSIAVSTAPMGEYHVASVDGFEVAGMMQTTPEMGDAPPMWTVFVTVDGIDAVVTDVERHGGRVLQPPFEIPGGARVAVVTDPSGAMFALIGGGPRPDGTYVSDRVGGVGWVELLTRDPLADVVFYEEVFGWSTLSDETTGYTIFTLDGAAVAGMLPMPAELPPEVPSHWATYFAVDDCDEAARRCTELGGTVHRPTTEAGGVRFAVLADPQGATFDVIELHPR